MTAPSDDAAKPAGTGRQIADYFQVVRRRWRLVAGLTLLALLSALALSLSSTKKYDATAKLLFKRNEPTERILDPNAAFRPADPERDANTSLALIKLETVAERVKRRLRLDTPTAELLETVSAEVEGTSDIVNVVVRDETPLRAAQIANTFGEEYVGFRRESSRRTIDEAARLARRQLDALGAEQRDTEEGRELQANLRDLEIASALQTGGVEFVRRASVPESPSSPRPLLTALLALALGLPLAIAAAFVVEFADRRLRDEEAVEDFFGLPVLATIPRPPRRADSMQPGEDMGQREAYGMLAANLRFAAFRGGSRTAMITSPGAGEGKTNVTLGLARALAALGQRVIAIEADLRRPTFAKYIGLPSGGGLTALLSDTSDLSSELTWLDAGTFKPVTLDQLDEGLSFAVLPAGRVPPNPQRTLARPSMAKVIEEARALADVVLIDTPPVGTVNDAVTLSASVDVAVLVARLNATTKDAGRRALRVLGNVDMQLAGLVITDVPIGSRDDYYYASEQPAEDPQPVPAHPASAS